MIRSVVVLVTTLALGAAGCRQPSTTDVPVGKAETPIETIKAEPARAPDVAPPTHRAQPAKVVVELEVREVVKEIADGVR